MSENTFTHSTHPVSNSDKTTTTPVFRGTKTAADLYAEADRRVVGPNPKAEQYAPAILSTIIDWAIATWKIEPLGGGLVGFQCSSGGSSAPGEPPPHTFEDMGIALCGYFGPEGRARAEAAFVPERVAELNRISPVFVSVFESESKAPNHYVCGKGLTAVLANRKMKFVPGKEGHWMRFRKLDGTHVDATVYPYVKGSTIVCIVPMGLTGNIELEISLEINGSIRSAVYPFVLG